MAITKDQFLDNLYQVFLKRLDLLALADARTVEEEALVVKYDINAANLERSALVDKYKNLEAPIQADIAALNEAAKG